MDKILKKNVKRSSQPGFTLVELLVVISIVGMLAGLMSVAIPRAMEGGKKAKAKGELNAIVAAVKAYNQEYGRWPGTNSSSDTYFENEDSKSLLAALGGTSTNNIAPNPKGVRFLEGASSDGVMLDPWKAKQYLIVVDTDESNSINYKNNLLSISVLAVSFGKDEKQDDNPKKGDDVFSTDIK
jgi:prepilin-type N-terminal cleavage/methylation domain-containing protein